MIAPGAKIVGVEVLSVDPLGRRAVVACPCGGVHVVGVAALLDGSVVCAAVSWTPEQVTARRVAEADQRRERDLRKSWRP
jgi:hypothetical protein